MTRAASLAEAMRVVAAADPAARVKVEMAEAVRGIDFAAEAARRPPQPSMAGQSPANSALIAAREAVHAEAVARDAQARRRRSESLEAEIRTLQAGQSPQNQTAIRATVSQG